MRRPLILAALVATLVPGATARAGTPPQWWSYDRKADFGTVKDNNVFVTMSDGTPIHCSVAQPATNGTAAPGRFPALMDDFTPYGGVGALSDLTADDYWADHGYVDVHCDIRGTGRSGGVWQGLLSWQENEDNYEILEWMRQQPWSNGRLGQLGASYGGMTSMRVASLQPPGLIAISPLSAQDDLYSEDIYPGGAKTTPGTGDVWPGIAQALSGGREIAAQTETQYLQHPLWDEFWQQISMHTKWDSLQVPVLAIGAWNDTLVPGGAPANWIGLHRAGREQNYLIMGPWGHASTGPNDPLPQGAQLAWFDHWLQQLPGAPLPGTNVTSFEQPSPGAGTGWHDYPSWPPPDMRYESWALTSGGAMAQTPGPAGTQAYTTLPGDANTNNGKSGGVSPAQRDGEVLAFDSAPLDNDLVMAGSAIVRLRAAVSYTDANFKAVLYDVAPDGTATFLNFGYLRGSHRDSDEHPAAVVPGEVTTFPIALFPMHWRFAKGHRLRVRVYGGEATELVPQPVPVTTTVSLGEGGSAVELPVIGG